MSVARRRRDGVRLVIGAVALAACIWLATWGCASQSPVARSELDWQHYEPDGGWKNFVPPPSHAEFEPDSARAAAGESSVSPVLPRLDIH